MKKAVRQYSLFLRFVGDQFAAASTGNRARCRSRCTVCCTGLFAISLLDALYLRKSFAAVPAPARKHILAKANEQLDHLEGRRLFSRAVPFLRSGAAVENIAGGSAGMRCPALGDDDRCMLYEHRPLLCRTFGPAIRERRTVIATGCGYFSKDFPEEDFPILSIWKDEDVLLRALFTRAGIKRACRIETIIPAALGLDLEARFKALIQERAGGRKRAPHRRRRQQ